jgi:hypothetical protein
MNNQYPIFKTWLTSSPPSEGLGEAANEWRNAHE